MTQIPVIFLAFANDHVDNASYLRNLPKELDGIRKALHDAQRAGLCEVVERANVTIEQLLDVFQSEEYRNRISIFHYGGHANGFQLLLEALDGSHSSASSKGLIPFLGRQRGLKMVFLNGCSSQQQSLDLVREGVPAVVGTSQSINDDVATGLAIRFYKAIGQGIELDRAWNEAVDSIKLEHDVSSSDGGNVRDLFWEGGEENTVIDRFPWDMHYREGSEIVKGWNLPDEVGNPLFNMPAIPATYALPETPFLFFNRYDRKYAPVFFGRSYYIRDLFNKITNDQAPPVILLYGQSGVGKSSLLDAGILPRLETSYATRYIRRDDQIGLAAVLKEALQWEQWEQELPVVSQSNKEGGIEKQAIDPSVEARKNKIEALILHLEDQLAVASPVTKNSLQQAIQGLQQDLRSIAASTATIAVKNILPEEKIQHLQGALKNWRTIEARLGKPLLLIIDQVEELFTRPVPSQENELDDFVALLSEIFSNPSEAPKGKIILGYRKEYTPDIEEAFKMHQLPRNRVFLESMSKKDLVDIFKGLSETPALQERYGLQVEDELPYIIADDLLEDKNSPVAPVLQILLTKLWQEATKKDLAKPSFTIEMYQTLKRDGILLDDFFHQQMEKMRIWAEEVELSGLALDILQFHTTKLGTAGSRSIGSIRERYQHRDDIIDSVMDKFKELYLLNESGRGMTTLAHDTIAPLIQMEFRHSDRPGQRATRILENKATALEHNEEKTTLDFEDLELVEGGREGMRFWVRKEQSLIDRSKERKARYIRTQKNIRKLSVAAVIIILVIAAFGMSQWQRSKKLLHQSAVNSLGYRAKAVVAENPTLAFSMAQYLYNDHLEKAKETGGRGKKKQNPQVVSNVREVLVKALPHQRYQSIIMNETYSCNIAFSPNGSYVATQDENTLEIKLWSIDGTLIREIDYPISMASFISFTNNNNIEVYYEDGTYKKLTVDGDELEATEEEVYDFDDFPWWNSLDGNRMLYQSLEGEDYRLFNAYGIEPKNLTIPVTVVDNLLTINSTGSLFAFSDTLAPSGRSLYSTESQQQLPFNYYAHEMRFSDKNENHISILSYDNQFLLFNIEEGQGMPEILHQISIGPNSEYTDVYHLSLSPDESHFLFYDYNTEEIVVWSIQEKREVHRFKHSQEFEYLGFSKDNNHIFAFTNNNVYLWDIRIVNDAATARAKKGGWVNTFDKAFSGTVNFMGDNKYVIGVQKNESDHYLMIRGLEEEYVSDNLGASQDNVTNILYVNGYTAQLWSGQNGLYINYSELAGQAENPFSDYTPTHDITSWTSSASSSSGRYIAMGSSEGQVLIWDVNSNEYTPLNPLETQFDGVTSSEPVSALHIDDNQNVVAVYHPRAVDASVQVYLYSPDEESGFTIKENIFKETPYAVAISPDEQFIALASSKQVYIWNREGELVEKCNIPVDNIYDIAFSDDGELLLVANKKGVFAWRVLPYLFQKIPALTDVTPSLIAEVEKELSSLEDDENYGFSDPIFQKKVLIFLCMIMMGIVLVNYSVKYYDKSLWVKLAMYVPNYTLLLLLPLLIVSQATGEREYINQELNYTIGLVLLPFLFLVYKESRLALGLGKKNQAWAYLGAGAVALLGFLFLYIPEADFELIELSVDSMMGYLIIGLFILWIHGCTHLWYKGKKIPFYLLMTPVALFIAFIVLALLIDAFL